MSQAAQGAVQYSKLHSEQEARSSHRPTFRLLPSGSLVQATNWRRLSLPSSFTRPDPSYSQLLLRCAGKCLSSHSQDPWVTIK